MDWTQVSFAKFLVKFAYIGTNYQGVAYQNEHTSTVELHLLSALIKTCLIRSKETCDFSRCGRTDKGVHAAGNYFTAKLRVGKTMDYVKMINRCLPDDIRILSLHRVPESFDARFHCLSRTYRYFFAKRKMDLGLMEKAAKLLVGEHDFRNFCKMDVDKTTNYMRTIHHINFVKTAQGFMYCEIKGSAFLWHMVRCIMAILFAVGQGYETVDVITDLLDVEKFPRKPNYDLADPAGLVLFDAQYPSDVISSEVSLDSAALHIFRRTHERTLRDAQILQCLSGSSLEFSDPCPKYTQVRKRGTGLSLEEALQRSAKRRRLNSGASDAEEAADE